jgi:hypothetical protein
MSAVTSSLIKFWDSDTAEIHNTRLRQTIPEIPKVSKHFQVVKGGFETLCFLALQIVKTSNKRVVVRSLASACMILFEDTKNYTGSATTPVDLTGLEVIIAEDVDDRTAEVQTNFEDAEPVLISELDGLMECDPDELGSYFGVLCLAAVKSITDRNRTAFNEKRQGAVSASLITDPIIFVTDSPFLHENVIRKVYGSFNSYLPLRSNMMNSIVNRLEKTSMGPTLAFTTMFLLLVDQGMSALRIIKEATVKFRWIKDEFPELAPEFKTANDGINAINKGEPKYRSFLKAIHGAGFVPVSYADITNLLGVCKFVLKETTISYAQYDGGKVTDSQEAKLTKIMMEKGLMRTPEAVTVTQE